MELFGRVGNVEKTKTPNKGTELVKVVLYSFDMQTANGENKKIQIAFWNDLDRFMKLKKGDVVRVQVDKLTEVLRNGSDGKPVVYQNTNGYNFLYAYSNNGKSNSGNGQNQRQGNGQQQQQQQRQNTSGQSNPQYTNQNQQGQQATPQGNQSNQQANYQGQNQNPQYSGNQGQQGSNQSSATNDGGATNLNTVSDFLDSLDDI